MAEEGPRRLGQMTNPRIAKELVKIGAPGKIRTRSRRAAGPARRELETGGGRHSTEG
jgi:hypothetical protein